MRKFELDEYFTNCKNSEDSYNLKIKNEEYKKEKYYKYKPKKIIEPEIGYKLKNNDQSINISKLSINIKNRKIIIYPNLLSSKSIKISQREDKKLDELFDKGNNHDVKLIKTKTNKYYLCFSIDCEIKNKKKNIKPISIDPNIRNIGVAYSENKCFEIGTEMYSLLNPMIKKRDILKTIYNKSIKDKIKGKISNNKFKNIKMDYRNQEEKIENRINDLHYKVINKLINDGYTLILIPKLNIKQILENDNMSSQTKKIAQMERHMKFIKRLQEKAKLEGIIVKIVNENMTTQCCGHCFSTKKFSEEIYNCDKCKNISGRDINSARNIYIKELCKITEFIKYLSKL